MCGITFLYSERTSVDGLRARTGSAMSSMLHRGPDDGDMWVDECCALGHRRLAIVDLVASRQPMCDPSGRYVLAYNGEVYNYQALRHELKAGWAFTTHGDTEVVLAGLVSMGASFLERMEGMWALALWDKEEQVLFLARDRIGKKPLYYRALGAEMACASELPALAKLVAAPFLEDSKSSADYLRYGYFLPGTTAYEEVREVLPGHSLVWRPGQAPSEKPYWTLACDSFAGTREHAENELRETLLDATRKRLVADVEVGAFLSGGVDSSLIVALLAGELDVHPKTFSIGFEEKSFDERVYARQVAAQYETQHFEECMTTWDRGALTRLILEHIGQPFYDASLLPTGMVSRLASDHVKVALSGDGGDELFSGYQRYQARVILRWYSRLPRLLQKGVETLVRVMPEPMAHHSRSLLKKAHLFLDIVARQRAETPYIAPVLYSDEEFGLLVPDFVTKGHAAPGLPEETSEDGVRSMMCADALVYLPQDVLAKVDRASMAHSIEVRAPFLDHKVIELAFSLPRKWHRRGFSGKRMLRQTFSELLPTEIWARRKQGFGVPLHQWFREGLAGELQDLLMQASHPLNNIYVKKLLSEHQRGVRDNGYRLWNIYVYLLFREQVRI